MLRSSIVDMLKTFTKEELSDFESFISSSYHNKNSIALSLYKEVKKYAPAFNDPKLAKESLWEKLYPAKKYNYGVMKNLIFVLKKLIEDYLSYSNWKKNSTYDKCLINELWDRHISEVFLKKANLFVNRLEKTKVKDQFYYTEMMPVQLLVDEHNMNRVMLNKSRTRTNDLLVESFLLHYLLNCFHLAVEMQKTKNKHDLRFLEYLLAYFRGNEDIFNNSPLLKTHYFMMLSFLEIDDDNYFESARKLFYSIEDSLPVYEIKNIYNVLILLCLFKEKAGKNLYSSIRLKLNIEMAGKEIFSHRKDGTIELEAYRNIVKLAANTNEHMILKEFINTNKHKVLSANPGAVILYSDATLKFAEMKFEDCLKICAKINFTDFWEKNNVNYFFKCDIKMLQIKSHYNLDHLETTINAIDSFRHLLNNASEINEQNKTWVRSFLRFLSAIISLRTKPDGLILDKLKEEISESGEVSSKQWLIEKIQELQ